MTLILFVVGLAVAFGNGANDVFKGFATVWGSGAVRYRTALILALIATLAGGVASIVIAEGLAPHFSGKGLVPDALAENPRFALAVASGACGTLLLATRLGMPVSTTHSLVGGLIGAGLAGGAGVNVEKLVPTFIVPLLFSPFVAAGLTGFIVLASRFVRLTKAPSKEPERTQQGGLQAGDLAHILSACAICFARAVNDAPKIAAILCVGVAFDGGVAMPSATAAMVIGGAFFSRRVAETISLNIARIDRSTGFVANVVTAALVLAASRAALPVSTTQVAVGAIVGAGGLSRGLNLKVLRDVLLSWLATLPFAASLSFGAALLLL